MGVRQIQPAKSYLLKRTFSRCIFSVTLITIMYHVSCHTGPHTMLNFCNVFESTYLIIVPLQKQKIISSIELACNNEHKVLTSWTRKIPLSASCASQSSSRNRSSQNININKSPSSSSSVSTIIDSKLESGSTLARTVGVSAGGLQKLIAVLS